MLTTHFCLELKLDGSYDGHAPYGQADDTYVLNGPVCAWKEMKGYFLLIIAIWQNMGFLLHGCDAWLAYPIFGMKIRAVTGYDINAR